MEEIETMQMFMDTSLEEKDIERESNKGTHVRQCNRESNYGEDNDDQISIISQLHCEHQEGEIALEAKRAYKKKIRGPRRNRMEQRIGED